MGSEVILNDKVYYKNKTFVACFSAGSKIADAKQFNEKGFENPNAFFEWLKANQDDFKEKHNNTFVVTYANIL